MSRKIADYVDEKVAVPEANIRSSRDAWMLAAKQSTLRAGCDDIHASRGQLHSIRAALKQEVESARLAILHLLRQQNILLPVSRLPAELLSSIFLQLRDEVGRMPKGWLVVMRICHDWRTTALSCASLWTDIPLRSGEKLAQVFLARSKEAAISLPVLSKTDMRSWQGKLVSEQIHRIKNIEFEHGATDIPSCFELLKTRTPERLEKLSLRPLALFKFTHEHVEILSRASRLQHIVFRNISFSWDILPWHRLRFLDVSVFKSDKTPATNFTLLATSLTSAVALEELHLDMQGCPFKRSTSSKLPIINLARLRCFTFNGFAADFKLLSDATSIPSTASLHILLYSDSRGAAEPALVSALLRTHINQTGQPNHPPIHEIRLSADRFISRGHFQAWQSKSNRGFADGRADAFIDISLPLDVPALLDLCKDVGLGSLRHLSLSIFNAGDCDWGKESWQALFSSAHNVESVFLSGSDIGQFIEALASPLDTTLSASDAQIADTRSAKRKGTATAKRKGAAGTKRKNTKPSDATIRVLFPRLTSVHLANYENPSFDSNLLKWFKARIQHAPVAQLSIEESKINRSVIDGLYRIEGLLFDYEEPERSDGECPECEGDGCEECMGTDWEDGPAFGGFHPVFGYYY